MQVSPPPVVCNKMNYFVLKHPKVHFQNRPEKNIRNSIANFISKVDNSTVTREDSMTDCFVSLALTDTKLDTV